MPDQDHARIYLATPTSLVLETFKPQLEQVLDGTPVACLRICASTEDASELGRICDQIREICHGYDLAVVIDRHFRMVEKHGLDGVHLLDGAKQVREARKLLGPDAIVGAYCEASKHSGITAAEIGVDYISFGPVGDMGELGAGERATPGLFRWWSEMIEVPVVAEGGLDAATLETIRDDVDFVTFGSEIWLADQPAAEARKLLALLKG